MAIPELVTRTDPTPAEIDFLEGRLYEFNSQATGIVDALGLAVFGHDAQGEVLAGLCGHTWGGCCEIRQVWVYERHRGQGLGVVFSNWRRRRHGAGVAFRLCSQLTASKRHSSIAS